MPSGAPAREAEAPSSPGGTPPFFSSDLGPPLLDEVSPATRITVELKIGPFDAVYAEGSEILSQLAPTGDEAPGLDESKRDRPDDALRRGSLRITIEDTKLAMFAHSLPRCARRTQGRRPFAG